MSKTTVAQQAKTSPFLPPAQGNLQRKCACGNRTVAGAECAECAKNKSGLQRKLTIGASNDPLELEADRIADQVMATPVRRAVSGAPPRIQRYAGQSAERSATAPVSVDNVLASSGRPLDPALQQDMEQRFGHDFSRVRVHTGGAAEQSARDVNAHAYTVGHNVVFGAGQFAPGTHEGRWLISHELTHVVQQSGSDGIRFDHSADNGGLSLFPPIPTLKQMHAGMVSRQQRQPDESPKTNRNFELDPQLFLKPMDAPAERENETCEEFPGGSTDCEVDEKTGTPTGKVTHRIDETNPCTRPCVEKHEAVHVKQLKTLCRELRDCYMAADKGKRSAMDCVKMAIFGMKERECAAYSVSVPCVENRLKTAKVCQSKENKDYGTRKYASEKCFRNKNCGGSGAKMNYPAASRGVSNAQPEKPLVASHGELNPTRLMGSAADQSRIDLIHVKLKR